MTTSTLNLEVENLYTTNYKEKRIINRSIPNERDNDQIIFLPDGNLDTSFDISKMSSQRTKILNHIINIHNSLPSYYCKHMDAITLNEVIYFADYFITKMKRKRTIYKLWSAFLYLNQVKLGFYCTLQVLNELIIPDLENCKDNIKSLQIIKSISRLDLWKLRFTPASSTQVQQSDRRIDIKSKTLFKDRTLELSTEYINKYPSEQIKNNSQYLLNLINQHYEKILNQSPSVFKTKFYRPEIAAIHVIEKIINQYTTHKFKRLTLIRTITANPTKHRRMMALFPISDAYNLKR